MFNVKKRTRYWCPECKIPYCTVGNNKMGQGQDCYHLAHASLDLLKLCKLHEEKQKNLHPPKISS